MAMTPARAPTTGLVGFFARSPAAAGRLLVLLGAALLALAYWAFRVDADSLVANWPLIAWPAIPGIGAIVTGFWLWFGTADSGPDDDRGRLALLALAALVGGATFLFGLGRLYTKSDAVVQLLSAGDRTNAWTVLGALAALIGGLAVMFAGLQLVRSEERRSPVLRRAVYGFNTFLTGFLLLAVLVVVNVLAVLKLPAAIDATRSGVHTLADSTVKLLAGLDRPLKVYVFFNPRGDAFAYDELRSFLKLVQEKSARVNVEDFNLLDPKATQRIRELMKQFPALPADLEGALLVYGDEKPENSTFIRMRDMISEEGGMMSGREPTLKFLGEVKFGTELSFLMGGKERTAVYFTQGRGEPDLTDSTKKTGLGRLKDRLEKRNFEVKALTFEPVAPKVPDDAKLIVVADPRVALSAPEVDALKGFLDRGGKLVGLFDVPTDNRTDKTMPPTGLEALLSGYGVDVTAERILTVAGFSGAAVENSDEVWVEPARSAVDNPIAAAFVVRRMPFDGVRLVRPAVNAAAGSTASPLFVADPMTNIWAEPDLQASGAQVSKLIVQDPKERSRLSRQPLPMTVTVTTSPPPTPGAARPEGKPKMVVFGDASFVNNETLGSQAAVMYFDLFASALEWLRERPANIGVEPRVYHTFEMNPDAVQRYDRLLWMPLAVAVLVIAGLGTGVWLVRRQ